MASRSRRNLNWNQTQELRVLKMLAWAIWDRECLGPEALWRRLGSLNEPVFERVIGRKRVTFRKVLAQTLKEQGLEITPAKLHQRADKVDRYSEYNEYWYPVQQAYLSIVAPSECDPAAGVPADGLPS